MGHKGYYGQYTGNAKWSKNHADTKVTKSNYKASERDDAAHIDYLKRDVDYDNKHGHSDENMTADEKHISKLAGDMKYDKEHHGSPAKSVGAHSMRPGDYASHLASASEHKAPSDKERKGRKHKSDVKPTNKPPIKMVSPAKHKTSLHQFMEPNMDEKRAKHFETYGKHGDTPGPSTWETNKKRFNDKKAAPKMVSPLNDKSGKGSQGDHRMTDGAFARHKAVHDRDKDTRSRIADKNKKANEKEDKKQTN